MSEFASDQFVGSSIFNFGSQATPAAGEGIPPSTPAHMEVDTAEQNDAASQAPRRIPGFSAESVPKVIDEVAVTLTGAFEDFLENFKEENSSFVHNTNSQWKNHPYMFQLEQLEVRDCETVYVDFSHVRQHDGSLADALLEQYYRFMPYLRRAVQNVVKKHFPNYAYSKIPSAVATGESLLREFSVAFYGIPEIARVRQLRTDKVGRLISMSGTVTRTTEVRPELLYGSFTCNECGKVMSDVEQQFRYTEPAICQGLQCFNRQHWTLNVEQSHFVDWQKIRIQENANEIPTGSMPRSLDVIVRGELVERAKAGDKCIFTGTLIVVPDTSVFRTPGTSVESQRDTNTRPREGIANEGVTGLKALGVRDLTYRLAFLACMVQPATYSKATTSNLYGADEENESTQQVLSDFTQSEVDQLKQMMQDPAIYSKLYSSIAPNVFGHEVVKKGILLQLLGGVHKQTPEGMNLRGDINVCIVGDPSTSKSQFLKYVSGFMPRAVYTSGKASSAAGLTASVIKDEETGEFSIEAGALMLADNGICCIDEFDKMDIKDQVAIHEAMEQQTISIAKAGIQASLNARTSILAAANPVSGRYNRKLTLKQNINMSAPIMSRFDLFFVVLDDCNDVTDYNIARHIINVHRMQDDYIRPVYSTEQLQRYIRYARTLKPKMTPAAAQKLADCYRDLRQSDLQGMSKNSYRITVRQLESMIRLSEAIARAHCQEEIKEAYVVQAHSLLQQSIIRVVQEDVDIEDPLASDAVMSSAEALEGMQGLRIDDNAAGEEQGSMQVDSTQQTNGSQRMRIDYETFVQIKLLLAHKLRAVQDSSEEESVGMNRSELIQWYLEQRESSVMDEEDLLREEELIKKVIKKLCRPEYETFIAIRQSAQYISEPSQETATTDASGEEDPIIMLHPNCVLLDD